MFILLCMLSLAFAEPPVGSFFQEYGPPNTREGLEKYGLPSPDTSKLRSGKSQEFDTPIARSSQHSSLNSDLNESFSLASRKTGVSQEYGAPSLRNSPSSLYGSPSLTSSSPTQYGVAQLRSSKEYTQQALPVHKSVPSFRDTKSHSRSTQKYGSTINSDRFLFRTQSSGNPSQTYGLPASSLSTQYGTSSAKSANIGSEVYAGPLKTTNRVPFGRNLDRNVENYGSPNFGISNSNANAFSSLYPSRRTPSPEYGTPSSRATIPSQEYGLPQSSHADQGYEYARNALKVLNQESANYEFAYKVSNGDTGSDFGHSENRQLDRTEGAYFVLLPDGTKQVVEYEADEDGFKPRISVEPVNLPTAIAAEGPY